MTSCRYIFPIIVGITSLYIFYWTFVSPFLIIDFSNNKWAVTLIIGYPITWVVCIFGNVTTLIVAKRKSMEDKQFCIFVVMAVADMARLTVETFILYGMQLLLINLPSRTASSINFSEYYEVYRVFTCFSIAFVGIAQNAFMMYCILKILVLVLPSLRKKQTIINWLSIVFVLIYGTVVGALYYKFRLKDLYDKLDTTANFFLPVFIPFLVIIAIYILNKQRSYQIIPPNGRSLKLITLIAMGAATVLCGTIYYARFFLDIDRFRYEIYVRFMHFGYVLTVLRSYATPIILFVFEERYRAEATKLPWLTYFAASENIAVRYTVENSENQV